MANERLRVLEEVEKEIAMVLQCAGNIVLELSKDKQIANWKEVERQLLQFQSSTNRVESELSAQIRYLTQVPEPEPSVTSSFWPGTTEEQGERFPFSTKSHQSMKQRLVHVPHYEKQLYVSTDLH
uniref:Mediator of RNA polymerase II transcription subunit 11 n=1 Tax=Oryzias latipes TaxID=8090 RepID=A0A3B3HGV7_ORYLA